MYDIPDKEKQTGIQAKNTGAIKHFGVLDGVGHDIPHCKRFAEGPPGNLTRYVVSLRCPSVTGAPFPVARDVDMDKVGFMQIGENMSGVVRARGHRVPTLAIAVYRAEEKREESENPR